jgi:hypothetical protein
MDKKESEMNVRDKQQVRPAFIRKHPGAIANQSHLGKEADDRLGECQMALSTFLRKCRMHLETV